MSNDELYNLIKSCSFSCVQQLYEMLSNGFSFVVSPTGDLKIMPKDDNLLDDHYRAILKAFRSEFIHLTKLRGSK